MDKTERKLDRRVGRTRTMLRDALMELIVEKGYQGLTVQEVADRADVARTTFYLHYKDVDDLLFGSLSEIYDDLFKQVEPLALIHAIGAMTLDFEHVAQYAAFYRVMLSEQGSIKFMMRVQSFLTLKFREYFRARLPDGHTPRVPLEIIAAMCAGAEISLMTWWITNDMQMPDTEIATMGEGLTCNGLYWALGIANPDNPV